MKKSICVLFIGAIVCTSDACAYLDIGTGSMAIQLLLGGFATAGILIKIYWQKIKAFIKIHWCKIRLFFNKK